MTCKASMRVFCNYWKMFTLRKSHFFLDYCKLAVLPVIWTPNSSPRGHIIWYFFKTLTHSQENDYPTLHSYSFPPGYYFSQYQDHVGGGFGKGAHRGRMTILNNVNSSVPSREALVSFCCDTAQYSPFQCPSDCCPVMFSYIIPRKFMHTYAYMNVL